MKRALLIVLDSVGVGHAPDAALFGDEGSNTMGHIRKTLPDFSVPTLDRCGLAHCEALSAGQTPPTDSTEMAWGCMTEKSPGKDTTTGHWEFAGATLTEPFATFSRFPDSLVSEMERSCGISFIGNYAQSGTVILDELGEEHLKTGHPILYTSSDSVIQIAAHEEVLPLEKLYRICSVCREIADRERIGRVIARPFVGVAGEFRRTPNRKDFSLPPPPTVLNALEGAGIETVGIGKISDIFAGSGISKSFPTSSNREGMDTIERLWSSSPASPVLYFANLVDFDMLFGHRRDVAGYGRALEEFDQWFADFFPRIGDGNSLVIITADHGNDPTWAGTDHTRERVPLLVSSPVSRHSLGVRDGFADVAATLSDYFMIDDCQKERSFLQE